MRYSTEPRKRKYVKEYGFLSIAGKFGDKYDKKIMDTATKTGIDTSKTEYKRVVQKTPEVTGDLIGNTIADKITSAFKPKNIGKEGIWRFRHCIKMEYQKVTNLLGNIPEIVSKCITEIWVEVHDQSGNANDIYKPNKQIRFKTSMLQPDLCDYSDAYIVVKETITVTGANNRK